jgi:hypothetical protein
MAPGRRARHQHGLRHRVRHTVTDTVRNRYRDTNPDGDSYAVAVRDPDPLPVRVTLGRRDSLAHRDSVSAG